MKLNELKKKIKGREIVFGGWTSLAHPSITEMFSSIMKPDFLGIDIEHGTINQEQTQRIIAAGQAFGVPVLPRVGSHNAEQIKRMLDSGADGIIVPMVNTVQEVKEIVNWSKYPPVGKRSYGISRAQGYGANFEEYTKKWNEQGIVIIQIESVGAVENVDAILDNESVDGVMIGPYDISGSLGIPGQLTHPKVLQACGHVVKACKRAGKACGTQLVEPSFEKVNEVLGQGYTFVVLSSDIFLIWKWADAMRQLTQRVRETLQNS